MVFASEAFALTHSDGGVSAAPNDWMHHGAREPQR
jgi:hypothetical protein